MSNNSRCSPRFGFNMPVHLSFGSQITLQGQVKDLSLKSAFVNVKSSVHMDVNDELTFNIGRLTDEAHNRIQGQARISRVAKGEGIAIYFTQLDEPSSTCLQRMISTAQ